MATTPDATGGAGVSTDLSKDPFISQLRNTLTSQSGAISSTDSNIESKINEAIGGVKTAAAASKAATESAYNRNIGYQQTANASSEASFLESQRGFATNTAAFRSLVDYNKKAVNDLEQRKQELLMQGDATAASKIADLQISKLDFENKAAQQTFTNLLSLGTFSLQQKQMEQAAKAQDFTESQAISSIALKYGLTIEPGDTIDTITKKAAPFASAEEKLAMEAQRSIINKNNADAKEALSKARGNQPFTAIDLEVLGRMYLHDKNALLNVVKTTQQLGQIAGAAAKVAIKEYTQKIVTSKTNGDSKESIINKIVTDTGLSPDQQATLLKTVEDTYGPDSKQKYNPAEDIVNLPGYALFGFADWFKNDIINYGLVKR